MTKKGSGRGLFLDYCPRICLERVRKTTENSTGANPGQFQTGYLTGTSLEPDRYTNVQE
jgi:hypothetical protein